MGNHLQGIEVLALVFMDPFHLHIKEGGGIHQQATLAMDVLGQVPFAGQLHLVPALQEGPIVLEGFEAPQVIEVADPVVADALVEQGAEVGIGQG